MIYLFICLFVCVPAARVQLDGTARAGVELRAAVGVVRWEYVHRLCVDGAKVNCFNFNK